MQKVFFSTIFLGVVMLPSFGFSQGKKKSVKPKAPVVQKEVKPEPKSVSAKALLEAVDQALNQQKQHKRESSLGYEIDGLVVDETLTKTGRDFYDVFYSNWEAPPKVNNFSVSIIERPLRGRGFQIVIEVNGNEINELNLQPQYDMVEGAALDAVARTYEYLNNYESLKQQLESDDQQGTGLF